MSGHAPGAAPVVEELRLNRAERRLDIAFDDGARFSFPAEFLRVLSPSAEVQGHGPGRMVTVPGKREVGISDLESVGNYAVRVIFDDGHDTGIYSWRYLRGLGENQQRIWADYLAALADRGLDREL